MLCSGKPPFSKPNFLEPKLLLNLLVHLVVCAMEMFSYVLGQVGGGDGVF